MANDGKSGVDLFNTSSPQLVLLDIMMPGIDGVEVLKRIRKESNVPVIMLTAKSDTFDKVLVLELGADDYIVKPFDPKGADGANQGGGETERGVSRGG